jgi:hypothetical protein
MARRIGALGVEKAAKCFRNVHLNDEIFVRFMVLNQQRVEKRMRDARGEGSEF